MKNRKSVVTAYVSENPSLISDPAKLARIILSETGGEFSLKELIKEIKVVASNLLSSDEDDEGYKKVILSSKTIHTKIDNEFDGNASAAARAMGVPERTVRRWYSEGRKGKDIKRFVVTYGQNDTPVHLGFYKSLQNYLDANNAELIVYKGKYRNPTSIVESHKEDVSWDYRLLPYLLDSTRELNSKLTIFPAHTSPTAVRPLSGFDTITDHRSGIFPHPKYQMKTVPTPSRRFPKILSTTGAITIPNYSKSKAGAKGEFHHIIGAVVVEIADDKKFHLRQISADADGSFYDIAGGKLLKYTSEGFEKGGRLETIAVGDTHYPFVDETAIEATFDQLAKFKPKHTFLHDIVDIWAVNHHERGNRFLNTAKYSHGLMDVEKEVDGSVDLIARFAKAVTDGKTHIVPSNHNDVLTKWLHDEKLDNLGVNAQYFHYLSWKMHSSAVKTPTGFSFLDAYVFSASKKLHQRYFNLCRRVNWLKRDVPYMVLDVDWAAHGDVGASGARGSALGFTKIGVKSTIGHSHSPQVIEGIYQVGVTALIPLGYAKGASGWVHTNCFQYPNGKRTLINMINGEYFLKD